MAYYDTMKAGMEEMFWKSYLFTSPTDRDAAQAFQSHVSVQLMNASPLSFFFHLNFAIFSTLIVTATMLLYGTGQVVLSGFLELFH